MEKKETTIQDIKDILKQMAEENKEYKKEAKAEFKEIREIQKRTQIEHEKTEIALKQMVTNNEIALKQMAEENKEYKKEAKAEFKEIREIQKRIQIEHEKTEIALKQFKEENKVGFKEIREIQKRTQIEIGGIGNTQGEIAEDLFSRNFQELMKTRGIILDSIQTKVKDMQGWEYDVVGANGEYVAILEIKNKLRKKDINYLTTNQLIRFKRTFLDYREHKVIGCVAGLVVDRVVELEAFNCGLFVFTQKGKNGAAIANEPMFKPVVF